MNCQKQSRVAASRPADHAGSAMSQTDAGSAADSRLSQDEIARFLLLPEFELDRLIRRAFLRRPRLGRLRGMISAIQVSRSGPPAEMAGITGIFKKYIQLKRYVLRFPGEKSAALIRRYSKDGGKGVCTRIDYCRRKAWISERLGILENLSAESAIATEEATDIIVEKIPDGQEFLELAKEFLEAVTDELAENVVPPILLIKVFRYGLDDLCPCCQDCGGSGNIDRSICLKCRGDGLRVPFVQ